MAERSKAPDSRVALFVLTERSGPRMWAWVRIPLLTKTFFAFFCHFHSPKVQFSKAHFMMQYQSIKEMALLSFCSQAAWRSFLFFGLFKEMDGGKDILVHLFSSTPSVILYLSKLPKKFFILYFVSKHDNRQIFGKID